MGFQSWYPLIWASLVAQLVKNWPAMQETPVQFLVGKIPWRKERPPTPVRWHFIFQSSFYTLSYA